MTTLILCGLAFVIGIVLVIIGVPRGYSRGGYDIVTSVNPALLIIGACLIGFALLFFFQSLP